MSTSIKLANKNELSTKIQNIEYYFKNQPTKINLSFIGFIQYELKAYEQRLPAEFKNDIRRFITRFQSSEKLYLSINLETLIASLLLTEKPTARV